jgi:hypothetical protein
LAQALATLRFDHLPRGGATRLVTRATIAWAEELGWLAVPEMALAFLAETAEQPARQGSWTSTLRGQATAAIL